MAKKHKTPELSFVTVRECSDIERCKMVHYAFITYGKKKTYVLLDEGCLRSSREYIIDACIEMKINSPYIAAWMERVYRWYLDQGGAKVR